MDEQRYKCNICYHILKEEDLIEGNCPECNQKVEKMCSLDKMCECSDDINPGSQRCPECGEFTCPCGSHSVSVISRVTGYLAEVGGWGAGKVAEYADRQRYNIDGSFSKEEIN